MKLERCIIISALLACVATAGASAATCAVDPVNGVDSPGAAVYKTLTYALERHGGGTTYNLAAGTYGAASGETFPIVISNLTNVAIVGPSGQKAVFDAAGANMRIFIVKSSSDSIAFTNVAMTGASVIYSAATGDRTGCVTLENSTGISFSNCEVSGNKATKSSGSNLGIAGAGLSIYYCDGVTFDGCLVANNQMTYNNWGTCCGAGAALTYSKNVAFSNCEFLENGSDGAGGQGGFVGAAVYSFAGLFANTYLVSFSNCLFRGNSTATTGTGAQRGACIALSNKSGGGNPTAKFTRCTFLENAGQPIYNTGSSSSATECVFVGNSMPDGGKATTYTDCLWEEFDDVYGYHPASGDDPTKTPAEDWYVAATGSDANAGHDAEHPLRTLGRAFSLARNNATIHVADGVYDAAGGETFPLSISKVLNLTIIGGDGIPVINAGQTTRALEILGCHGLSITNLAITGGKSPLGGYGGGALLRACRGVLSSCAITNNQVTSAWYGYSDVYGGGLYACGPSSDIVIDGCLVADNDIGPTGGRGGYGGGAAVASVESFVVSNSAIRNNGSSSANMKSGGGIYANNAITKFRVFNTLFTGNRAVTSGAAVYTASAGTMENCTVADNLVSVPLTGTLTLLDSICTGNAAEPASTVTLDHTMTTAPGFVGDSYLVASDSDAIDAGSVTAASVGLGEPMTVRADGAYDTGVVDLGYHQVSTGPVVAITDLYVSTSGSDSNDGLDAAHPLRSITKALSLVQNGTTVHVSAGTYGAATGETFPLALAKSGLSLVCEDGVAVVDAAGGGDCALAASGAQNFTLRRVVFANARRIGTCGGGLDIRNSSGIIDSCVVTNCMVSIDDASQFTTYGGGLYLLTSSVLLTNCTIVANGTGIIRSNNPRSHGGALCAVSGSSVELAACSIISNFTANANFGVYGAALSSSGASASLTLRNCLVAGNRRQGPTAAFSTIAAQSGTLTVENCTIADNAASRGAVGNFNEEYSSQATVSVVNSILCGNGAETNGTIAVSHTLIRNGDEDAVNHVVAGDPRFLNPPRGDYRLRGGSPCLNTGLNAGWMKAARDLAGNPRLRNGAVDLGCYECTQSPGTILSMR